MKYEYDLGCCMFCELCVTACPSKAIEFSTEFENAVFDRSKLVTQLNRPGSKVAEKKPVAKPAPKTPAPAAEPSSDNTTNEKPAAV